MALHQKTDNMVAKTPKKDQTLEKDIPEPIATTQQPRSGSTDQQALVPVVLKHSKKKKEESGLGDLYKAAMKLFYQEKYKEAVVLLKKCTMSNAKDEVDGHYFQDQATAILGFCFEFGLGAKQDFVLAEKYYLAAAASSKSKIGLSYCRLAFLRYYGRPNVVIDRSEAEEWKRKALDLDGKATAWLEMAANQYKIPSANYAYGVCFHDGVGIPKSPETAILYYKRAAAMGDPRGEATLGYCYGEGFGVEKDQALAFSYYMRSAERGESVSMYNVGYCYEQGLSIPQSNAEVFVFCKVISNLFTQAIKWYKRSAALGNCYAQNSLGYIYEEGQGVEKDHLLAAQWYKKSAIQGYPWAQCNYAYCLQNGLGVETNPEDGCYWYKKAALQGHSR